MSATALSSPKNEGRPLKGPGLLTGHLTEIAQGYQQVLSKDPRNPEALVGMSLIALASRQSAAAVEMAAAAMAVAPNMGTAWVALGQALKAENRVDESEQAYQQAIRLDGVDSLAHIGLGELQLSTMRPEEAAHEFELALKRRPELAAAHLGLGNAFALAGRNEEALAKYEHALALQPRQPEAEFAAGFALARLGRVAEAETRYRRALTMRPDFAAVWVSLGCLLHDQGREVWAEAALKRSVELRPDLIAGWVNLAILERDQGRPDKAEEHLREAFALNPDQVETLVTWCQFRAAEDDLPGAWAWLRWVLSRDPANAEAANMQGILLHTEGRFQEAVDAFERAEALGSKPAPSNCGNSLLDLGRMQAALKAHETAVKRDPTHPGALYNLALTRHRLGDWERGWQNYEARWHFREVHRTPRIFDKPRWRGEPLRGRRVLLHAEQGLGDSIQFSRYASLIVARGGTAILQVQQPVERLMSSLDVVRTRSVEITRLGAQVPESEMKFDLECPLMSLPAVFGTTIETVPWTGAYLGADPDAATAKRFQFLSKASGPRVGIAWAGNPRYKADCLRSIKLVTLLPLLRHSDFTWISLQKGEAADQLSTLPDDVHVHDGSSRDTDLADTAALIATIDLVITTDTSIAHLAGAMAKPVWILLPHLSDWRWMQNRETTPWYPSARLFRQQVPGDWAALLNRVAIELESVWVASQSVKHRYKIT